MTKPKAFDCVQMKNEIQARLAKKYAGLTLAERSERIEHELATSDDPIAIWWRKVREVNAARRAGNQ
jgi:hypothetical protein